MRQRTSGTRRKPADELGALLAVGTALEEPAAAGPTGDAEVWRRRAGGGRRLRIGIVAPPYVPVPPSGYGGTERVIAGLVEELVTRGHDVTLFAAPGSRARARLVVPLAQPAVLGDADATIDELLHAAVAYQEAGRLDLVHDHTTLGPVLASLRPSPPVVHTLHGRWTPGKSRLFGALDERVRLVAISDAQRATNPSVPYCATVHNGIQLRDYPFRSKKDDYLIFLGRACADKGPATAIDVARAARLPLVMLVKRTEPSERRYWDEVIAPKLGDDIVVIDEPPSHVKLDLLARARATLFPIAWPEPFGLVLIESMACGTPVIAHPAGAVGEIVEPGVTGFVCQTADAMVEAVADAGCLDAARCRRSVEARFSAAAMAEAYERVYLSALAGVAPRLAQRRPLGAGRESQAGPVSLLRRSLPPASEGRRRGQGPLATGRRPGREARRAETTPGRSDGCPGPEAPRRTNGRAAAQALPGPSGVPDRHPDNLDPARRRALLEPETGMARRSVAREARRELPWGSPALGEVSESPEGKG
jgi:glycosyltransferase involved in cell wall biosynthesis